MPVLGVTGGIAAGKSTVVQAILRLVPADLFDADQCARELLNSHEPSIRAVVEAFGSSVLESSGRIDRSALREIVFAHPTRRKVLEEILHPLIRQRWTALSNEPRARRWLIVDIPLLFETGADSQIDRILVVACSPPVQRRRLAELRGFQDSLIENIIGAQLDIDAKMRGANHIIWNDSTITCLERQVALFARWLNEYYG